MNVDKNGVKVTETYTEMMQAAISKGLRSIDVTIVARTYRTVIVKATLVMRARTYASLAEGTWSEGIEAVSRRAKVIVLMEALGMSCTLEEPRRTEATDNRIITIFQLRLLQTLYDRLGKSEEDKAALSRLSKQAASALITMLKHEAYRREA